MAKFLPVIGELYTTAESTICAIRGTVAKLTGDEEKASLQFDAAENAWIEYAETNMIAALVTILVSVKKGNFDKRDKIVDKYKSSWENAADGLPVVGKYRILLI